MNELKKKEKSTEAIFILRADFGYREFSPIPAKRTGHHNTSSVVLAIPGTYGELFPGKRPETIEFLSYLEDDKGYPCGIRCKVRDYSEMIEEALEKLGIAEEYGIKQKPETELELYVNQPKTQETNEFENGVTTYRYRKYRLEWIEQGKDKPEASILPYRKTLS